MLSRRAIVSTTKAAKKALRTQMKQRLAALDPEDVSQQSRLAQETLLGLSQYKQARRLSVYLSMPTGEAGTDVLVEDALKSGKSVFVPYMYKRSDDGTPSKVMDMLRLTSIEEYQGLSKDNWGIPTLPEQGIADRENAAGGRGLPLAGGTGGEDGLDMIVMPAVAFDTQMRRLGHGAGYYDSFLARHDADSTKPKPFLGVSYASLSNVIPSLTLPVGLCLAEQLLQDPIPVTDLDHNVDAVVTGAGKVYKA